MRSFLKPIVTAVCLAAVAVPAHGQVVKLTPRIGLYAPLTDLGEVLDDVVSLDNSLALGLGLEFHLPLMPFNLRANLDYASDATITGDGVERDLGRTTVLAVVGDAVFRFPGAAMVQPYLFVGGGLKQYAFDTQRPEDFRDASDPTLHLGGGLDLGIGGFALTAELGDYISRFRLGDGESRTQHDVFLTLGLSVGLF